MVCHELPAIPFLLEVRMLVLSAFIDLQRIIKQVILQDETSFNPKNSRSCLFMFLEIHFFMEIDEPEETTWLFYKGGL